MRPCLPALLLVGCARDPVLLGYWDIERLAVGSPDNYIEDAGTIEFHKDSKAIIMLRCAWDGQGLVPAMPTGPFEVPSDAHGGDSDIFNAYAKDGEQFTVTIGYYTYDITDWGVNEAVLESDTAAPPPDFGTAGYDTGAVSTYVGWTITR